jgi:hypothetical protein
MSPHEIWQLAPNGNTVTHYDRCHYLTYARILDAEFEKVDWREGARTILGLDADRNEDGARRCWESHIARAQWMATVGYRQILETAGIS